MISNRDKSSHEMMIKKKKKKSRVLRFNNIKFKQNMITKSTSE